MEKSKNKFIAVDVPYTSIKTDNGAISFTAYSVKIKNIAGYVIEENSNSTSKKVHFFVNGTNGGPMYLGSKLYSSNAEAFEHLESMGLI